MPGDERSRVRGAGYLSPIEYEKQATSLGECTQNLGIPATSIDGVERMI